MAADTTTPIDWHAHGMDWAFVESTDPAGSDEWTTDDVARAFAAGAGLAERIERQTAVQLRGQLDVLRGWIREALGPLEVSEALIEDEDGGAAMRELLEAGRQLVNASLRRGQRLHGGDEDR